MVLRGIGKSKVILIFLLIFGAILRFKYINYPPFSGDETSYINTSFRVIFNNLEPRGYTHPALYFYIIGLIYSFLFFLGKLAHLFSSWVDFAVFFIKNKYLFYSVSRALSIAFSLAAILLVYKIGRSWFNGKTALLIAGLLVISRNNIFVSREASIYSMISFFILLSWYCGYRLHTNYSPKYLILNSIIFALAFSTDYFAVLLLPMFLIIFMARGISTRSVLNTIRDTAFFFSVTILIFILCNPYAVINTPGFIFDLSSQLRIKFTGEPGRIFNPFFYLESLAKNGPFDCLLFILFIIGAGITLRKPNDKRILLAPPLLYIILIILSKQQGYRFISPAVPILCVISGEGIHRVFLAAIKKHKKIIYPLLFLSFAAFLFQVKLEILHKENSKDYFAESYNWALTHIPRGAKILTDGYTVPFLDLELAQLFYKEAARAKVRNKYYGLYPGEKKGYNTFFLDCKKFAGDCNAHYLTENKIDYVVLSRGHSVSGLSDWVIRNGKFTKGFGQIINIKGDPDYQFRIFSIK